MSRARLADQWKTYVAAGDLEMHWDFACRNGELTISNFDNQSFTTGAHGLTQIPGINQFCGAFTGLPNGIGGAIGSFADNVVNNQVVKAGGVLGNFYVNETTVQGIRYLRWLWHSARPQLGQVAS